ncbi:ExbD/TolR family protein [Rariglobus hedericola]|uniref:Biopolymer transporter ExbD n=1 Tax=Rariglobus hedericola TaxID=2597822 RepID=A0A556QL23_9BACT|nr:biopolymer transporter ExbD [Rariglobus hedericola]TSJ77302.1 biopolymer transporter ExbD [Rariglobus hedericola]
MAGGGSGDGEEPEFQIAPMIDVLLVLLIFFMSSITSQVARVDKSISLPVAPNASKQESARDQSIINVRWDAAKQLTTFVFEDVGYERLDTVVPILTERKKHSSNYRLVIRGDRLVPAEQISIAMSAAASAGIADITFAAAPR